MVTMKNKNCATVTIMCVIREVTIILRRMGTTNR